ncbi:DNA polymerase III subunit chi [Marinihelvus fidelis]|uniref:DNA polymerase III subunit chi n=1 Tax=Marinihelvus fidelis TaxID=2613842 RepID=A0A5N0T708_9GAMM|nr:DNA polymerase III subunit chi [Marinihelvus fidelis]KAA9130790.1 DNA polymerase III subunit chi [Marinihelvus fidelis]
MTGDPGCKVDFYLLGSPRLDPDQLACKLAMMAWERGHRVDVVAEAAHAERLDALMWSSPEGRFLPHAPAAAGDVAPVRLGTEPPADADLVINLTQRALDISPAWRRLLEIVPHDPAEREASREKFKTYRGQGLAPDMHEMN